MPVQFETESAQNREYGSETGEVHAPIYIWRRRGQSHRKPTFCVGGEQAANIRAVHGWKIGPVLDVVCEVVHTNGIGVERMSESDDKLWQPSGAVSKMQSLAVTGECLKCGPLLKTVIA